MLKWLSDKRKLKAAQWALQESEEIHRGNSSDGGTGREEPSPPPSTIGDVKPGHHVCCIYETEEEHRAVVVPFLRQGLERGEKVLYIVDARDVGTILDYLWEDGLDPEPYLERGQLSVLSAQDAYLKDGVFDPDAMIALLRAETDQALVEGYAALRVTGEMSWALRGLPGSERLIEYEAKLNHFFPGSKCLAICQYDRRAFSASLLLDVLATHPIAVVGTSVHDNLYYVPAADLLGPDPQAARLRAWTRTLDGRKEASVVPVEPHASSALDGNGEVEYFHSFHADTTERKRTEEALRERIKELNCLYGISKLLETPGISLEQVLQGTADLLLPSWQYPEVACARIVLEDKEFQTENFKECPRRQASDITLSGERIGSVEVCYLEERPESDEGPFLKEERRLIDAVAERLGRIVQRKRAEQERKEANQRAGALIRAIPDMMFILREDGTYLDFIPADGQKPLSPPSEFLGRTVLEVMPTGLARRMMHHIEAALTSGEVQRLEYELEVEGETHNFETRFVAMAADEVLAIARDVTAKQRLEHEKARQRARDELEGKVERAMLGRNPYGLPFREFSVLHLVARGAADKEIADQLGVSTFTVNKHVANILGKMNASSRTEAGVRAHREGLIS